MSIFAPDFTVLTFCDGGIRRSRPFFLISELDLSLIEMLEFTELGELKRTQIRIQMDGRR